MYYQRQPLEKVFQNECSWGFCGTQGGGEQGGGVLFWCLFFIKLHAWGPVNLLWGNSRAAVFLWVLRKYLMAASELSELKSDFFGFRYFEFYYLSFNVNIVYFLWYKHKSINQFSLSKLVIFFKQPLMGFQR